MNDIAPAETSAIDRTFRRMHRNARSRWAPAFLFVWSLTEAFFFPLIPDAGLAAMAFSDRRPRRVALFTAVTVVATVIGSVLAVALTRAGLSWPMPLTTDRMAVEAAAWVAVDGASGLVNQPLTGIPVKVFNATGAEGVPLHLWALWIIPTRGVRMAVVALAAMGAGWGRDRFPAQQRALVHVVVVGIFTVLVLGGLALLVRHWS